ncbi:MAG: hypothetical protein A2341_09220 [Deltaproteobacteria bacterium RIFOXYB12_FULL_58_9]|nr:MAG: hypothetical protein A2341_09220 [Deltaproteobacteria bacterium RIFOXYB12_FULL_58_9]
MQRSSLQPNQTQSFTSSEGLWYGVLMARWGRKKAIAERKVAIKKIRLLSDAMSAKDLEILCDCSPKEVSDTLFWLQHTSIIRPLPEAPERYEFTPYGSLLMNC